MPSREIPRLRALVERAEADVRAAERALADAEEAYSLAAAEYTRTHSDSAYREARTCLSRWDSAIVSLRSAQDWLDGHQANLSDALIDLEVYGPPPPVNYGSYRPIPEPGQTEAQYFVETYNANADRGVGSFSCQRCGHPVPAYRGTVVCETCGLGGSSKVERD